MTTITPSEYWYAKEQIKSLVGAYHSVNDKRTIQTQQALIYEHTAFIFERSNELLAIWDRFLDVTTTREQAEAYFTAMKMFVLPMELPSTKQIDKLFRKVKKMNYPNLEQLDPRELSYLGWTDAGTNRKFIIRKRENRFEGVYGTFSTDIKKGHCAICNHISAVGFFLATTKTSGDGTYTKNGNYICSNSILCNQQLTHIETFDRFFDTVSLKK